VTTASGVRGQPLAVLLGLLLAWVGLRATWWQAPSDVYGPVAPPQFELSTPAGSDVEAWLGTEVASAAPTRAARAEADLEPRIAGEASRSSSPALPSLVPAVSRGLLAVVQPPPPTGRLRPARAAIGHSLLLAAGISRMDLPPALAAYFGVGEPVVPGVPAAAPMPASLRAPAHPSGPSRLSADAWLMVRDDTISPVVSGRPSYGRSQAGGVVRYRLAPSSPLALQAHVRASSALAGPLDRDLAAGLSARLSTRVPVRVAVEARIGETARGTELRPAVIAVTELPPLELPHGTRAEAYLQGGYVGGAFATAFVDGQARIERPIGRLGDAEVRAGAGAWGGAQEGAARLDIGPTAAVAFRLGEAQARVAADYRFRVAGDAEPRSGPALTVSAGF
jgi:hypothetical protein